MIDIRRCNESEAPQLMAFIDTHWRKGHSLAVSRTLMDWQHRAEPPYYNYLMAWDGDALLGVLGYIPTRRYDPALKDANVLWLALWKIRDDCKVTGLGLRMLRALEQQEPHVTLAVNGINLTHPPMYQALGYRVAELEQCYLVNPAKPRHLIQASTTLPQAATGSATCIKLSAANLETLNISATATPHKTPHYFINRFLNHPFYKYAVYLLAHGENKALIATRVAEHAGSFALRIVDMAGDTWVLAHCGSALQQLMQEADAEYTDFWQHGIDQDILRQAGFGVATLDGLVTVPNFYEPFVPKNGRILCAYKTKAAPFIACRADGDQDRPNALSPE